jgi:hypothetical protein
MYSMVIVGSELEDDDDPAEGLPELELASDSELELTSDEELELGSDDELELGSDEELELEALDWPESDDRLDSELRDELPEEGDPELLGEDPEEPLVCEEMLD